MRLATSYIHYKISRMKRRKQATIFTSISRQRRTDWVTPPTHRGPARMLTPIVFHRREILLNYYHCLCPTQAPNSISM